MKIKARRRAGYAAAEKGDGGLLLLRHFWDIRY